MEKAVLDQQNFNRKLIEINTVQVYTRKEERQYEYLFWFKNKCEVLVFDRMVEEKELVSIAPSDIVNIDFQSFGDAFINGLEGVPDDVRNERYLRIQVIYPGVDSRYNSNAFEFIAKANQYEDIKNKILQAQLV